jgi:hypothetical protein
MDPAPSDRPPTAPLTRPPWTCRTPARRRTARAAGRGCAPAW